MARGRKRPPRPPRAAPRVGVMLREVLDGPAVDGPGVGSGSVLVGGPAALAAAMEGLLAEASAVSVLFEDETAAEAEAEAVEAPRPAPPAPRATRARPRGRPRGRPRLPLGAPSPSIVVLASPLVSLGGGGQSHNVKRKMVQCAIRCEGKG